MRKKALKFHYITLTIICQALAFFLFAFTPVSAGTQDFYFDSFDADYYLSKDSQGVSHLKVVENLTAIFPDYNQNKGIVREIPFTNQEGKNITLKSLDESNIIVLRNGEKEPIWSIEKYDDYYEISTGTDDYLTGPQTYTFIYEFNNVITNFSDNDHSWQELYWDTNGTGWRQKFNSLTARVHFSRDISDAWAKKAWCYVGKYGASDQSRCTISQISDGIELKTSSLAKGENLTFDLEFHPGTFTIPEKPKNFILIIFLTIELILGFFFLFLRLKAYRNTKPLTNLYKSTFIKPEYCPPENLTIPETPSVAIKKITGSEKVALLIDLAVKKKIQLIKLDKKENGCKWRIKLLDLNSLTEQEKIILEILNHGADLELNQEISIKNQTYSPTISALVHKFDTISEKSLVSKNLISKKPAFSGLGFILFFIIWIILGIIFSQTEIDVRFFDIIGDPYLWPFLIISWLFFFILIIVLEIKFSKFNSKTESSIKLACYLEGLELYIKMAESDRLKILQSVEGADISHQGIVNLYEKLLPYAILFRCESSWLNNLQTYYNFGDTNSALAFALTTSDLNSFQRFTNSSISSGSHDPSSSSSSGSSGGGGGGFSGGGGGGGGGGGR